MLRAPIYDVPYSDPFAAVIARFRRRAGDLQTAEALITAWCGVQLGSAGGDMRYPWQLSHKRLTKPAYASESATWKPWRPSEAVQNFQIYEFEERFITPIVVCEAAELLLEVDDGASRALFHKLEPTIRRELVKYALSQFPWHDTFALRCLVSYPLLLARMQPFALAIASAYGPLAEQAGGRVLGQRFPFHEKFLTSATALLLPALS